MPEWKGSVIVSKVKDGKNDFGFNAKTEEFENMMKAGIIDPAKVVRVALQHASSKRECYLLQSVLFQIFLKKHLPYTMPGGGMPGMM